MFAFLTGRDPKAEGVAARCLSQDLLLEQPTALEWQRTSSAYDFYAYSEVAGKNYKDVGLGPRSRSRSNMTEVREVCNTCHPELRYWNRLKLDGPS